MTLAEDEAWANYDRLVKDGATGQYLDETRAAIRAALAATPVADTAVETMTIPIAKFLAMTTRIGQLEEAVADTAGIDAADRPFVVRQFEGTPWVPLHEAARLHDAVQSSGLTIAALRNDHALRGAAEGVSKLTHGAGQWFGSNDWRPCSCFAHEALAAALRTPKPEGER